MSATLFSQERIRQERIDLAAAFRLCARENMHEAVANHFSMAVSEDGSQFLVNPRLMHFARIRAKDLLLVDSNDPDTMQRPDAPDPTAWAIHGAIHRTLPHARCILHGHTKYATVLASLADSSIPPIDQNAMRFFGRMAIDDGFGGMGLGEEAERLAKVIGDKPVLMMGNHGVMVIANTVAEAYDEFYYLERTCQNVVIAYMTGKPLRIASDEVAAKTAAQWARFIPTAAPIHFAEMKHLLDEENSNYADL